MRSGLSVLALSGGIAVACARSEPPSQPTLALTSTTEVTTPQIPFREELLGAEPLPHVDRELVRSILELEVAYTREDLQGDPEVIKQHLQLAAEFFVRCSGEDVKGEELVNSIQFLPADVYEERFGRGTDAGTDPLTGEVFIKIDSSDFLNERVEKVKGTFPYWSALSQARIRYWHEWEHRVSVPGKKPEHRVQIVGDYWLEKVYGFALGSKDPKTGEPVWDTALEEAIVIYLTAKLEKQFSGILFLEKVPANKETPFDRRVNRAVSRFMKLFQRRPNWEGVFQKAHTESDLLGIARLLAEESENPFKDDVDKISFGLKTLLEMSSPQAPTLEALLKKLE